MPQTSPCRSCGRSIWFATTVAGKSMPLNEIRCEKGNVQIVDNRAHVLGPIEIELLEELDRHNLWTPHFATCPNWKKAS